MKSSGLCLINQSVKMSFPVKNRFKHDCELPKEYFASEIHSPIDTSLNVFLSWWRDKRSIGNHSESLAYFRSLAGLKKEKNRHTKNPKYKWIIHPFSPIIMVKNTIISTIWFILVNMESFCGSFLKIEFYQSDWFKVTKIILLLLNLMICLDIILEFFTGFQLPKLKKVMLEPEVIRKSYLRTFFIFDLIPVLITFIVLIGVLPPKISLLLYLFVRLRWIRLYTFFIEVDIYVRIINISPAIKTVLGFGVFCFLIIHQWTCIIGSYTLITTTFNFTNEIKSSWIKNYLESRNNLLLMSDGIIDTTVVQRKELDLFPYYLTHLTVVICYFTGSLPVNYEIKSNCEMVLFSFILITGMAFYIYSVAKVLQIFGMINVSEEKYEELFFQLEDYILKKNFAPDLRKRIFSYVDYKYNKRFFSELQISNSLSEHLRMEVLLYSCRNLISEVKIFKGLSKSVIGCILALLNQEIYLSHDVIMSNEHKNDSIYFVLYGTCTIKLSSGQELTHIEDGSHFGNTSGFSGEGDIPFSYSIVSLEVSEIYELKKSDIRYCCATYPEMYLRLENVARYKARKYNVLFALREHNEETTDEILGELRQGKILMHGLKRAEFAVK